MKLETWNNIFGNELWVMTSSDRYPNQPDTTLKIDSLDSPKSVNNLPDKYGLRMTTYYKVRETFTDIVSGDKRIVTPSYIWSHDQLNVNCGRFSKYNHLFSSFTHRSYYVHDSTCYISISFLFFLLQTNIKPQPKRLNFIFRLQRQEHIYSMYQVMINVSFPSVLMKNQKISSCIYYFHMVCGPK